MLSTIVHNHGSIGIIMQRLFTALVILIAAAATASAQSFPSRIITIVVPLPPGGASDLLARTIADHMKGTLGQPVIVENLAGAGGTLSINRVARAPGDGYTLSFGNWATHVASAATYPVQYDILNDIVPVAKVADTPLWMVAKKALPAKDLKELIAWIKANQDKASAGIVGFGSGGHICGLTFQNATGTRYQFVPYKGGAPAMQDLVAGQIDFMCDMAANSLPQARAGNIKPMAVMAKKRWFAAPDVPTAEEMGVPEVEVSLWHGLWASKGTPPDVIARLNAAVVAALADPAVQKRLTDQGHEVAPREQQSPEGFAAFHKAEADKWWPVIKKAGIKAQ
jgi:tripartite-type tricarboxylate transporter receptor subunit TctC